MNETIPLDRNLLAMLESIASEGINHAAGGFSRMVGRSVQFSRPLARLAPVLTLHAIMGRLEEEVVGIYLPFKGDVAGQIMMIVPHAKALELADLLLDLPQGSTQHLGSLERSALGELGNLCGSFFLNSIARMFGLAARPSVPAVMVDMVGAILDIMVATTGGLGEYALIMQTAFSDGSRCVQVDFWVLPDLVSLSGLIRSRPVE